MANSRVLPWRKFLGISIMTYHPNAKAWLSCMSLAVSMGRQRKLRPVQISGKGQLLVSLTQAAFKISDIGWNT